MPDAFLLQGLQHPRVKAYYDFMVDVAIIFGASKNNSERELLDVIQFEAELVKVLFINVLSISIKNPQLLSFF